MVGKKYSFFAKYCCRCDFSEGWSGLVCRVWRQDFSGRTSGEYRREGEGTTLGLKTPYTGKRAGKTCHQGWVGQTNQTQTLRVLLGGEPRGIQQRCMTRLPKPP